MDIGQLKKKKTETSKSDYLDFLCADGLNIHSTPLSEPPAPSPKIFYPKLRKSENKY